MMMARTRSELLFLDLFRAATLTGAVEIAARRERAQLFHDYVTVPVDVYRLAETRGIQIEDDLVGDSCAEGLLVPCKGGYRVRLKGLSTNARRRFSLAHELGHTLFYHDGDDGPRHKLGILSHSERAAEERICDLFAAALLMPIPPLLRKFEAFPSNSPAAVLNAFEQTARKFRVSLPALINRLRSVNLLSTTYLVLCFRMRTNPATGREATQRVESCVGTGHWRNVRVWLNRSAAGMGLRSVMALYDKWQEGGQAEQFRGCFTLDVAGDLSMTVPGTREADERISASRLYRGKWRNELVEVLASSALYAWGTAERHGAYVVAVLAPFQGGEAASDYPCDR